MSLRKGMNGGFSRNQVLDKRIPKNPRYAKIQSKVKTGRTVDTLTFVTTRQQLRRQDEPFFRLSPWDLSELLMEYEQDRQEGVQDFRDHIDPDHHGPKVVEHEPDAVPSYERPYLILDVRELADFRRCHITQARSFEAMSLKQDRMTPELYRFKNKEGGLVIVYSKDDKTASSAATILTQKGFNNVFVLSGGVVDFAKRFQSFVEGDITALSPIAPLGRRPGGSGGGCSNVGDGSGCSVDRSTRISPKRGRSDLRDGGGSPTVNLRHSDAIPGGGRGSGLSRTIGRAQRSATEQKGGRRNLPELRKQNVALHPAGCFTSGRTGSSEAATAPDRWQQRRGVARAGEGGRAEGGGGGEVSRGSMVSVADSVISRANARRGRWS